MVSPRLIHPQTVVMAPIDKASTQYDLQAREPIAQVRRSVPVTISAQIHWGKQETRKDGDTGPEDKSDGWLVFLAADLTRLSYQPTTGDVINSVGGVTYGQLFLIEGGKLRGQYHGAHYLLKVRFEDRSPRKE